MTYSSVSNRLVEYLKASFEKSLMIRKKFHSIHGLLLSCSYPVLPMRLEHYVEDNDQRVCSSDFMLCNCRAREYKGQKEVRGQFDPKPHLAARQTLKTRRLFSKEIQVRKPWFLLDGSTLRMPSFCHFVGVMRQVLVDLPNVFCYRKLEAYGFPCDT
mmetsp:Transcript_14685/g.52858  ORF Transcript_14685/g.52858 Transcript_14685/m.52858 type:complete len:157 (-) Transcript_14685:1711-2181(-)